MQVTLTQRATNRMEKHGRTVLKTQSQLRAVWWLLGQTGNFRDPKQVVRTLTKHYYSDVSAY